MPGLSATSGVVLQHNSEDHISIKNTFLDVRNQEEHMFTIRRISSCPPHSTHSTSVTGEPSMLFTKSRGGSCRWSDLQDSEDDYAKCGLHWDKRFCLFPNDTFLDELPRQTPDIKWKKVHMSASKHLPSRTVYMSEDPWSEVCKVNPVYYAKKKKHSRQSMAKDKKKDLPKFLCTFYVGIEDESSFTVAKRIIGPQGRNMKFIADETPGSKIRLRGKGSMFKERDTGFESMEPLQLNISVTYQAGYERAKELVKQLLNNIYYDHERVYGTRPALDIWEDPRNQ
eukprot:GEMP01013759.1.p1 GENE.GEMP01013759.1~~GEMP01013759.1.p1  ORF type:complete len:283 (-),score=51.94 GEMP01013759.1:1752-2600(-)